MIGGNKQLPVWKLYRKITNKLCFFVKIKLFQYS